MSGYGVPGIPGRSGGKEADSTRLPEKDIEAEVEHHQQMEQAEHARPRQNAWRRLFRRR